MSRAVGDIRIGVESTCAVVIVARSIIDKDQKRGCRMDELFETLETIYEEILTRYENEHDQARKKVFSEMLTYLNRVLSYKLWLT